MILVTNERLPIILIPLLITFVLLLIFVHIGPACGWWGEPRPVFTDFVTLWCASELAQEEGPAAIFSIQILHEKEQEIFPTAGASPWHYPPTFLLFVYPLSWIPFWPAAFLYLGLSLWMFVKAVHRFAPFPQTYWYALAYPATLYNFGHGQNGFITAGLLGWGLIWLYDKPILAGIGFGLLSYKPHLGVLIPIALLAGRYWKVLYSYVLTCLILGGVSLAVFGIEAWWAFFNNIPVATEILQQGAINWAKMPTVFSAVRTMGGGLGIAQALQTICGLILLTSVISLWYRQASFALRVSVLCLGMLLITPYSWDYDLTVLLIALVCYTLEAEKNGWIRGEKTVLVLCWCLPFIANSLAMGTRVQLGAVGLLVFWLYVIRRYFCIDRTTYLFHFDRQQKR